MENLLEVDDFVWEFPLWVYMETGPGFVVKWCASAEASDGETGPLVFTDKEAAEDCMREYPGETRPLVPLVSPMEFLGFLAVMRHQGHTNVFIDRRTGPRSRARKIDRLSHAILGVIGGV